MKGRGKNLKEGGREPRPGGGRKVHRTSRRRKNALIPLESRDQRPQQREKRSGLFEEEVRLHSFPR